MKRRKVTPTSILIVDDDPDYANLLFCELSRIPGVTVRVAHNSSEAICLLTRGDYTLVVSDWALASTTAPEVLRTVDHRIHDDHPEYSKIPVMFISGSEKVRQTQELRSLQHFEPVSFILKRCGPPLIGLVAKHILVRNGAKYPSAPSN